MFPGAPSSSHGPGKYIWETAPDLEDHESWTRPSSSRGGDLTGTSQSSVISTLFGRTPAFPAGIHPSSLDWNSSAFAALPRVPGLHAALPQGLFLVHLLMQTKTSRCQQRPSPRALCDRESWCLHIVFQPNISFLLCAGITLPDSGEIISLPPAFSSPPFVRLFSPCAPEQDAHRLQFQLFSGCESSLCRAGGGSPPQPPTIPQPSHQACPCTCCSSNAHQTTQPLSQHPAITNRHVQGQGEARRDRVKRGLYLPPFIAPANLARCRCIFNDMGLFFPECF